jgi:hypothetical protein
MASLNPGLRDHALGAGARILMLLFLALQARCREICKAFHNSTKFDLAKVYSDYREIGGLSSGAINFTVYAHMCSSLDPDRLMAGSNSAKYSPDSSGLKPTVMVKLTHPNNTVEFKDIAFYYGEAKHDWIPWKATVITNENMKSLSGVDYARMLRSKNLTAVSISYSSSQYKELVSKVLFLNICFKDSKFQFFDSYFIKESKTVVFQFNGEEACGEKIPNYITFLSEDNTFVVILSVSAIIGLILDKDNERLIMALSSVQASIMTFTSLLFMNKDFVKIRPENTKHIFNMLCLLSASVSFGLSYFNRVISLAFVCVSVSYAIIWTLLYLIMLVFQRNVPIIVHITGNVVIVCVIVLVSVRSVKIREKYSYYLYTAVTNSFFLSLAIFVYSKSFLDIVNFNSFLEYGHMQEVELENWYFIFVQSLLTAVTVYRQVMQGKKLSRKHNAKAKGSRTISERITSNENELFGEQKHVNETLIAM